ncbi:hypothetical protein [Streptomyces sp. NPDC026673]|uniref:hypothetical protein n=1 Tax=Streptomyces sp. NPDC026673 TaxID=3155724 RepID=UPI0033CE23ED
MNAFTNAPAGTVGTLTVNGTAYQFLKLDDGTYAVEGGDWMVTNCRDEHHAMFAILDRIEELQARP